MLSTLKEAKRLTWVVQSVVIVFEQANQMTNNCSHQMKQ